ncbi:class I SAM-dependent methyltransferase [Anabaena catenula]|uniref:Class I SAM-dependent methyltransferase n=1 Tax=Anabaena catenula FACHB-362 TaxID=2692877 RepID=A0ABR8IZQ5_9NOST|nr:class I SAM-dependent methyltransferase [Anabaena catenula]MBD2691080.1 class I SAM-dependent methyltransferase [Anabaena catenula FACHB-362]
MQDNNNPLIQRYLNTFSEITHLNIYNIHIFEQLLGLQKILEIPGDILEIGVLEGATSALLATSLEEKERLFLIDPYQNSDNIYPIISHFSGIENNQLVYFQIDSIFISKRHSKFLEPYSPLFRFIHIDGEHSYDAVYSDMDLSTLYISNSGLIVLDDIFNINSACCTHAMFDYLKSHPNLHCVAMGFGKAYLCESRYINVYRKFFINLPEILASVAGLNVRVSFNSWAYERSYVTLSAIESDEQKYQIIGQRLNSLNEVIDILDLNLD